MKINLSALNAKPSSLNPKCTISLREECGFLLIVYYSKLNQRLPLNMGT